MDSESYTSEQLNESLLWVLQGFELNINKVFESEYPDVEQMKFVLRVIASRCASMIELIENHKQDLQS